MLNPNDVERAREMLHSRLGKVGAIPMLRAQEAIARSHGARIKAKRDFPDRDHRLITLEKLLFVLRGAGSRIVDLARSDGPPAGWNMAVQGEDLLTDEIIVQAFCPDADSWPVAVTGFTLPQP